MDENDKRLKHQMQTLLPRGRFEHMVNLEPIKVGNGNSPNKDIISAADPAEPHGDHSTLPEEVTKANWKDELCSQICAYLKAPSKQARPTIHLNSCRISNGLLMKADRLWVPEGEENLKMRVIKKIHD